jgi:hypothetical protein
MSATQCFRCEAINGGAGDFPLKLNPETMWFQCSKGHQVTADEVSEAIQNKPLEEVKKKNGRPRNTPDLADLSDKKQAKTASETPENGDFEVSSEIEKVQQNDNGLGEFIDEHGTKWSIGADFSLNGDFQVVIFADGDQLIPVRVPHLYLESIGQEAENEDKTVVEWLSERISESLENYFVAVKTV